MILGNKWNPVFYANGFVLPCFVAFVTLKFLMDSFELFAHNLQGYFTGTWYTDVWKTCLTGQVKYNTVCSPCIITVWCNKVLRSTFKRKVQHKSHFGPTHYSDVIMGAIASQITSLTIVYSTVYSDADERKHQSSASLAFVWEFTATGEFPAQMASNAENVSIWRRHHENTLYLALAGELWGVYCEFNLCEGINSVPMSGVVSLWCVWVASTSKSLYEIDQTNGNKFHSC